MGASSYHHGNLKQALVDHAVEILSVEGEAAMTLRAVARRAGVTQAAPYHHFADWDALVEAVADVGFRQLLAQLDEARAAAPPNPRRLMQDLAVAYVRFALDHPAHYRLMFGHPLPAQSATSYDAGRPLSQLRQRLAEVVVALQDRGLARRGKADDLAITVWSLLHGLAMLLIDGQMAGTVAAVAPADPGDVERLVRGQTELILHGMMSTSALSTDSRARAAR